MSESVRFRPEQDAIVNGYRGGKMGISAVPGSGKTFTLSHLAARLIGEITAHGFDSIDPPEVLIVTFTNSAVNSFQSRIAAILQRQRGLLPYIGYRVRTLHALAHDIVRERPALAGLSEDFQIVDDRVSLQIIQEAARSALGRYSDVFAEYYDVDILESNRSLRRVESRDLPLLVESLAQNFIKQAKNSRLDPLALRTKLEKQSQALPLVEFGLSVYEDYQRGLSYRGAVDFDDLVRLAIQTLERDTAYCARLQERWQYILEDEAQDSSKLQQDMLALLSKGHQNWVRVGDPKQAINTTFTTADPQYLTAFLAENREMPLSTSGRSAQPIIDMANWLVDWTITDHPTEALRGDDVVFKQQAIRPAEPDDPQLNPSESSIYIHAKPGDNVTPDYELELVAKNLTKILKEHPDYTVAALAPENNRGYKLAELLKERGIDCEELLRSTAATREVAAVFRRILQYLSNPLESRQLAGVYHNVWCSIEHFSILGTDEERQRIATTALDHCRYIEHYLWPVAGDDWLDTVDMFREEPEIREDLVAFRDRLQLWLQAALLPVDQLILTLTQDLFTDAADVALGHKIAAVLRSLSRSNPLWRLPQFVAELKLISENQRKFIGFDDAEHGFEPTPGKVTIATMHAAKGLEWDRVYLLGVSNYGFPSAQPYDNYIAEKWFIRDNLNLDAEMLAQLAVVTDGVKYGEGLASARARLEYAAERLRLLYVGMTRARHDLMITWNMGRFWDRGRENRPALPLSALWAYWYEEQRK